MIPDILTEIQFSIQFNGLPDISRVSVRRVRLACSVGPDIEQMRVPINIPQWTDTNVIHPELCRKLT